MVKTRMSLTQLAHYYPDHYEIADEHRLLLDAIDRGNSEELDHVIANHLDHAGRKGQFETAKLQRNAPSSTVLHRRSEVSRVAKPAP